MMSWVNSSRDAPASDTATTSTVAPMIGRGFITEKSPTRTMAPSSQVAPLPEVVTARLRRGSTWSRAGSRIRQ